MREGKPIWLGIPIYNPAQLEESPALERRKGTFWFQLIPSPKIRKCLMKGAMLRAIRLNVPSGPTHKIVADVILEADTPEPFSHGGDFLAAWDKKYREVLFPQGTYLGTDFNRFGPHTVELATATQEIDITDVLKEFDAAGKKLEIQRKVEIPNIQRKLASGRGSHKLQGRWKTEITLKHHRRKCVLADMRDRKALMVILYIVYRTGARYIAWDAVQGIATLGKKGDLAVSVTNMPKKKALFDLFVEWAEDLRAQGLLPYYRETRLVPPVSRDFCAQCFVEGRGLRKTRAPESLWDEFICADLACGYRGSSHANSARLAALLLKNQVESQPVASIDGRG
jgi:hypothetical protein